MSNILRKSFNKWPDELKEAWVIVEDKITQYLPTIDCRFRQFTRHDVSHLEALENILDWLVPTPVWKELNDYEMFCLRGAIWSHDIGMGANKDEIELFCKNKLLVLPDDDDLLWFLRDHHPQISRNIISNLFRNQSNPSLTGLGNIIGDISESHGSHKLEELQPRIPVGHSGNTVRPVYLAILLRLADILHCTADRAPMNLFKARAIDDPISVKHWKGHQSTVGIGPDYDNGVVLVHIIADDVVTFDWATQYCDYIQQELDYCANVISRLNLHAEKLTIAFHKIKKISDTPFLPRVVRIKVDVPAAVALLAGKHVYNDDSVVVRELLQNAIDAIKLRQSRDAGILPEIILEYNSTEKWVSVTDNGIGMALDEIEEALLASCTSGFRRVENPEDMLARYGIGFLTTLSIGSTVVVCTRHVFSSPSEGYQVTITGSDEPVEIRQIKIDNPGTKVCVYLSDSATITKEDILKWTPAKDQLPWITITYDGQQIKPIEPSLGIAEQPLNFINKNYSCNHNGIKVVFRSAVLVGSKNDPWPCGLSFQDISSHDVIIDELPDVKGRLFVGSIPIVQKDGQRPRYQVTNKQPPAYEKIFGPFDLHIDKPGLIDLNIARNGLIETDRNDKLLHHAGELACHTILKFYKDHTINVNKALISSRTVSEFWLCRLFGYLGKFLFGQQPLDDLGCIEILNDVWDALICNCYIDSNMSDNVSIGELRKLKRRIVFLWQPIFNDLKKKSYPFQTLIDKLSENFGKFIIVTDCGADSRRRFSPVEIFFSVSRSLAMFDPLCANIDLPPLLVFSLCEDTDFPPAAQRSVELYGSNNLFFGYWQQSFGIGMRTGSNTPRLMVNLRADAKAVAELREEFLAENNKLLHLPAKFNRESPLDWFVKMGVPDKLATLNHMHTSLRKRYPLVGDTILRVLQ
jgi:hypothetical protein